MIHKTRLTQLGDLDVGGAAGGPDDLLGNVLGNDWGSVLFSVAHSRGSMPLYTFLAAASSPRKRTTEKLVSTAPGATSVTRIPVATTSLRTEVVKARTALRGV